MAYPDMTQIPLVCLGNRNLAMILRSSKHNCAAVTDRAGFCRYSRWKSRSLGGRTEMVCHGSFGPIVLKKSAVATSDIR